MLLHLEFIPYLIKEKDVDLYPYDYEKREFLEEANLMTKGLIFDIVGEIKEYAPFQQPGDIIKVVCRTDFLRNVDNNELQQYLEEYFGNENEWIGELAVDTWLGGADELFHDPISGSVTVGIALKSWKRCEDEWISGFPEKIEI